SADDAATPQRDAEIVEAFAFRKGDGLAFTIPVGLAFAITGGRVCPDIEAASRHACQLKMSTGIGRAADAQAFPRAGLWVLRERNGNACGGLAGDGDLAGNRAAGVHFF